ncbi:MAG: FAD binding domain-containing protein [Bacteroidia bacterium]
MIKFILNEKEISTDVSPGTTLLDFIRYHQNLKGTKIGCREGDCGACTVLVGSLTPDLPLKRDRLSPRGEWRNDLRYRSATSCLMALGNANAKHIVTVEGINFPNELNPIQQAMSDEGATQCGFCTPGFVISLAGYCLSDKEATEENAIASIDGNICRCTGYKSIERAALKVNELLVDKKNSAPEKFVSENKILPEYFISIKNRLQQLLDNRIYLPDEQIASFLAMTVNPLTNNPITRLGGGTDLYVQKHDSMTHSEIDFLLDNNYLKGIYQEGNKCFVGASCTVTDLCESGIIQKHFPQFLKYAKLVSSTPIRNIATLAGNFVNASPIGDFTIFFLALEATLILSDGDNKREIALKNFYKGYKTLDKKPEEYIEKFYFELPDEQTHFHFEKVSKRTHLDIASVNTAIQLKVDGDKIIDTKISAGGVFAYPKFLEKASEFLKGKNISEENILNAIEIAETEIAPISDARGSEEYKRLLLAQLIKAHFVEMFKDGILTGV